MNSMNEQIIHATALALPHEGKWQAVLLRGPSGAGKSDLAFRMISNHGARLIADDQTALRRHQQTLVCASVPAIERLLEVRGVGLLRLSAEQHQMQAPLLLAVDLVAREAVARLPSDKQASFLGIDVPLYSLHAFDVSTPAKIIAALAIVDGRQSVIR